MPRYVFTREGALGTLVLPLTSGGQPYPSTPGQPVALVLSGLDGRLAAVTVSDPTRIRWLDSNGSLAYTPAPGELVAAASPYRAYAALYNATFTAWQPAPSDDYWLITVLKTFF